MRRTVASRVLLLSFPLTALLALMACDSLKLRSKGEKKDAAAGDPVPAEAAPAIPRSPEEAALLEKCATLGAGGTVVAGQDGWFFDPNELRRFALLHDPALPSVRSATAAIADYRDQLKRKGIELILVPVPPKVVAFPDKLAKDLKVKVRRKKAPPRLDSSLQNIYAALRSKGVRVIDVTEALLDTREDRKLGPVYPRTAATWAPRAAQTAAAAIARELKDAAWANQPGKDGPMITEDAILNYTGPLNAGTAVTETLGIRNVGRSSDEKMRSVTFSQGGHPLALMGDETLLAWREANNPAGSSEAFGSLADQLAFELQTTPDVFPGKSDGRNEARLRILREGTGGRNPLSSAKTLLWVISATDFALSDWKKVPLRLDFNLDQPVLQLTTPDGTLPAPSAASPPSAPGSESEPPLPN